MKSAGDWIREVHEKPFLLDSENRDFIHAIQADALMHAHDIARRYGGKDADFLALEMWNLAREIERKKVA